jgi:hypothetical protein
MKKLYFLLFCILPITIANAQSRHTLSGYIRDASNGEELIGATLLVRELGTGTATNAYGFYSLTLPAGTYTLAISYLGFRTQELRLVLDKSESRNVSLEPEFSEALEITVTDKALDANVTDVKMSRNELDMRQIRKLPALFGEPDIIKTIQMLPGVITAGEGTSAFFVRGGSADQNLILIDEAPVYDPSHLFGLFSVFNADVIKDSELYKGGIPARYGGRLSSILDVRTKDGNNQQLGGSAGIGTLASKVMVEGPLRKEKSSFIVSARRSYLDMFLKAAGETNLVHFYDINAKVNWRHSNKNRFFLALYSGRDVFSFDNIFGFDWGNTTATFRWNHLFNDRLFSNTSLIASNFDYGLEFEDAAQGFLWTSNLQEITLKQDFSYFINRLNEVEFGYHLTYRRFSPGRISPNAPESLFTTTELQRMYALDHAIFLSNRQRMTDRLALEYGVRLSIFQNLGPTEIYTYSDPQDNVNRERIGSRQYDRWESIRTYINPEARVSARYLIDSQNSIKASYNRMVQNTHLIASGTVPLPFNTWQPSSPYLRPQLADQVAVGWFRNLRDNAVEFSVEAYYKDMKHVTDFADNAEIFFNEDIATEFRQGISWSRGVEWMLNKKEGKLTGFTSYTLSKTERKVPGVNNDQSFVANYDRRHAWNVVAAWDVSERLSLGGNFTLTSGRPITIPSGRYEYGENYNPDVITARNTYLLPTYHRLDLSATLQGKKNATRRWKSSWVFSIYNVYSRRNAFTIYTRTRQDDEGNMIGDGSEKEARMIYLFPALPSITYTVKF